MVPAPLTGTKLRGKPNLLGTIEDSHYGIALVCQLYPSDSQLKDEPFLGQPAGTVWWADLRTVAVPAPFWNDFSDSWSLSGFQQAELLGAADNTFKGWISRALPSAMARNVQAGGEDVPSVHLAVTHS